MVKKQINVIFLGLSVILIPLMIMASDIHHSHVLGMITCGMIYLAMTIPDMFLRLFFLYASAWLLFIFGNVFVGRYDKLIIPSSIDTSLFLVFYSVFFVGVMRSKLSKEFFFNCICVAAIVQAVFGVFQFFSLDPVSYALSGIVKVINPIGLETPVGTLGNPNFLGAFLVISLPFFIRKYWSNLIPLILFAIFISGCKTAILITVILAVFYFSNMIKVKNIYKTGMIFLVVILTFGALLKYYGDSSLVIRMSYWKDGLSQIFVSWETVLFGFGPGITWKLGDQFHSEYMSIFFNWGVIGLFLVLAYMLNIYRGSRLLFLSIITIAFNMIANHTFHTVPTAILSVMVCSLNEREKTQQKEVLCQQ